MGANTLVDKQQSEEKKSQAAPSIDLDNYVPLDMYNALKEKLYGQESELKKHEEEIFTLNSKIIESEQNEASILEN